MLLELAPEWTLDIDRGPDWLFIRLRPPHGDTGEFALAEMIWQKLEQCFCHRVVVELDDVSFLRSWMVGELVRLHKRVTTQGGMMRLCGLSEASQDVLRIYSAGRSLSGVSQSHRRRHGLSAPPAVTA